MRRRLARRSQLVRARTRAKNEIHAVLIGRLQGRPPVTDVFGVRGRRWLSELELPADERDTVAGCLRHIDFLDAEVRALDQAIAREALRKPEVLRLMTVPGVSVITASTFIAAIGDIRSLLKRAPARRLPRPGPARSPVRARPGAPRTDHQAGLGSGPPRARRGRVGHRPCARPAARLLRARARPPRRPGRRGRHRAQAREPVLVPAHPRAGLRLRAAITDAPQDPKARARRRRARRARVRSARATAPATSEIRDAERALALQAEEVPTAARSPTGRPPDGEKTGASVTPGRASQTPSKGKAARQTTSP